MRVMAPLVSAILALQPKAARPEGLPPPRGNFSALERTCGW
jgi:hypothetical protein